VAAASDREWRQQAFHVFAQLRDVARDKRFKHSAVESRADRRHPAKRYQPSDWQNEWAMD